MIPRIARRAVRRFFRFFDEARPTAGQQRVLLRGPANNLLPFSVLLLKSAAPACQPRTGWGYFRQRTSDHDPTPIEAQARGRMDHGRVIGHLAGRLRQPRR